MASLFKSLFGRNTITSTEMMAYSTGSVPQPLKCDKNIPCFNWLELLEALISSSDVESLLQTNILFTQNQKSGGGGGGGNNEWDNTINDIIRTKKAKTAAQYSAHRSRAHYIVFKNFQICNVKLLSALKDNKVLQSTINKHLMHKIDSIIDKDQTQLDNFCYKINPECPNCILFGEGKIILHDKSSVGYCDRR